jgi:hypothetical protein
MQILILEIKGWRNLESWRNRPETDENMANIFIHLNVFKIENEEKDVVDKVPVVEFRWSEGNQDNTQLYRPGSAVHIRNGLHDNETRGERETGLPLDLVVLINSFLYERLTDENFKQAIALWFEQRGMQISIRSHQRLEHLKSHEYGESIFMIEEISMKTLAAGMLATSRIWEGCFM